MSHGPLSQQTKAAKLRNAQSGHAVLKGAQQATDAGTPPRFVPRGSSDPLWLAQLKWRIRPGTAAGDSY
jgi:hypothetical protein